MWLKKRENIKKQKEQEKICLLNPMGAGEIRETANLINRGNISQEISEHFLRKTRIAFFIPGEWSKQPHHIA